MTSTVNPLKTALSRGDLQVGLWCSLASALSTEVVAGSGADWLLIDTEHSPNDLSSVVAQLQALGRGAFLLESVELGEPISVVEARRWRTTPRPIS